MCVSFESNLFVNPWSGFPGMLTLLTTTFKNFKSFFFFFLYGFCWYVFVCFLLLQVQCCRFHSLFLQICLSVIFLFWFCGWERDLILNFCCIIKNKQTLGLNLRKWLFIPKKSFTYLGNYWWEYFNFSLLT